MSASDAEVWISAPSPLLQYSPVRDGKPGEGWYTTSQGTLANQGHGEWGVEYIGSFSSWTWFWAAPPSYIVSVGLDGSISSNSAAGGSASLAAKPGNHSITLSASCETCGGTDAFQLIGARLTVPLANGNGANGGSVRNGTLDDSSSEISYSGWTSSPSNTDSPPEGIRGGRFFQNTISYTSTRGASAKLSFRGSAINVFAPTGPDFGEFSISIDTQPRGVYNGASTLATHDTLLYFTGGLGDGSHTLEIVNEEEGRLLALDYFVATAYATASGGGSGTGIGPGNGNGQGVPSPSPSIGGPFASDPNSHSGGGGNGNGSAGAVIGGILGTLAALALLFLGWRYYQWKNAGGEGSVFEACCGPRRKPPQAAGPGKDDFKIWPMIRSRPKYAT